MKNILLSRKRHKKEKDSYLTVQKLIKNYREKQKSHAYSKKQKFLNTKKYSN